MNKTIEIGRSRRRTQNVVGAAYIAAVVVLLFAVTDQIRLKYRGYIYEGRGLGATRVTGKIAQEDISIRYNRAIICLIIAGALHLRMRHLLKNGAFANDFPTYVICTKCLATNTSESTPDMKCLNCGCPVESLIGFYDRHPELKTKP
jgi:hypothetical protein